MSKFTINFENEEQYRNFIKSIKEEVLNDMKPEGSYHPTWEVVRQQMEYRFKNTNYNDNCGHHYNNMQSLYAVFRLAFQQRTIKELKNIDGERIQKLHDELFYLIDKYREENKWIYH